MDRSLIERNVNTLNGQDAILGIDEAGRGPVLGPMVYACLYCTAEGQEQLVKSKVDDSKKLKESDRERLFQIIKENADIYGWTVYPIPAKSISSMMLRKNKYNLNSISHDTAIEMISDAISRGVRVKEVYVDTVGKAGPYQNKLQTCFPSIKITVAEKADALYPVVSAASICAKVRRDQILSGWKFEETGQKYSSTLGSGYPADENTVKWLNESFNKIFGFPNLVRFSWGTSKKIEESLGYAVNWYEEDEEEEGGAQQQRLSSFFTEPKRPGPKLPGVFARRGISAATQIY